MGMEFYMETRIHLTVACEAELNDAINLLVLMYSLISLYLCILHQYLQFCW